MQSLHEKHWFLKKGGKKNHNDAQSVTSGRLLPHCSVFVLLTNHSGGMFSLMVEKLNTLADDFYLFFPEPDSWSLLLRPMYKTKGHILFFVIQRVICSQSYPHVGELKYTKGKRQKWVGLSLLSKHIGMIMAFVLHYSGWMEKASIILRTCETSQLTLEGAESVWTVRRVALHLHNISVKLPSLDGADQYSYCHISVALRI